MNFIKRLFKKKNYNIGIIRFGDNIIIPGRDYFEDENKIKLLELYKKNYIEELCKRKAVTTLNFNSNTLKQDMKMNIDLILRVLLDNEDFYLLAPEELIIQSLKLRMYYEEINALEEETILRLMGLKEIEKSKKIPRHNRMALEEEINQLSIILEMYSYRKSAINIELKNYFNVISTKDLEKQDTEIFKQRLAKLLFITDGIIDKQEIDKYEDIKMKIAILERICERYAYQNKEEAYEIKGSLDLSFENKILLFYEYGKNYYDESLIREFYLYKFNMLTKNINNSRNISPIDKNDYGFKYYEDIISNKIQNIQSSFYFSKLVSEGTDISSLLEDTRIYLKNEYGEFDYGEILTNKFKIAFIMSLDYTDLKEYFYKNVLYLNIPNDFGENLLNLSDGVEWCDSIPLASCFEFMTAETHHPLYYIYKLNRIKTNLLIPEGVKSIDFNKISIDKPRYGKQRLPKTVKSICGHIKYDDCYYIYHELELNDGLECIGSDIFKFNAHKISIPSSVKEISLIGNTYTCNADCIEFRDFKNSEILNNEEKFFEFIRICSTEVDTHKRKLHRPSEYNLKIQERYRKGGFSTSNHAALFDREYTIHIYKLRMLFSTIVFTSDDIEKPITISAPDLKIFYDKADWIGTHNYVGSPNYYEVYSKIRQIIKEETGYDIFEKAKIKTKKLK